MTYVVGDGWVLPVIRPSTAAALETIRAAGADHKHRWEYGEHWTDPVRCAVCGVEGLDVGKDA